MLPLPKIHKQHPDSKLALVGFRRGRIMTPKQIRTFREKHFKSREAMAKEFNTTARTIRAYEAGENKNIPGIFVKAVELWLKIDQAVKIAKYPPQDRAILGVLEE